MIDQPRVIVGAGVDAKGGAAISLDVGGTAVVLDIYAAMNLVDLIDKKIGEAINWHKLALDPDTPSVLGMVAQGLA